MRHASLQLDPIARLAFSAVVRPPASAQTGPTLPVRAALGRFRGRVIARLERPEAEPARIACRVATARLLERVDAAPQADTPQGFERVLNGCLELGYRARPLAEFVFSVLQRRLAARVRRRLAQSGIRPDPAEVADLVAAAAESIQRLLCNARRAQYTLRYSLLISIADHRTIDWLRRHRAFCEADIGERPDITSPWLGGEPRSPDPESLLRRVQRRQLALRLRDAIFESVNGLPRRDRAALILVEIEGVGYSEVADRLGLKRTDVGNLVRRARVRRDRALMGHLRGIEGLKGHLGFAELQAHKPLRLNMLTWSAEAGEGACPRCRDHRRRLHPLDATCGVQPAS